MPISTQITRGYTQVAAGAAGIRAVLDPYDRITGARGGAALIRISQPSGGATIGDLFADIYVGGNLKSTNYAVPAEEYAGAGPNTRTPAVKVNGRAGDVISIVYRNADGTNPVPAPGVQHYIELASAF